MRDLTCIPLNSSKEMMEDTTNDPPSVRAILSSTDSSENPKFSSFSSQTVCATSPAVY